MIDHETESKLMMIDEARPLRILRAKDVAAKLGIGKTKFYDVCKLPSFPERVSSAATGVCGWWEHEIDAWMTENYERSISDGEQA